MGKSKQVQENPTAAAGGWSQWDIQDHSEVILILGIYTILCGDCRIMVCYEYIYIYIHNNLWWFNIAIENGRFIVDLPSKDYDVR